MNKWWIKRLKCGTSWSWIAVGPDRVLRYFSSQPEAMAYATTGGKNWVTGGWLKAEMERARQRSSSVPPHARPVLT
jgi:hypothetical protein